ncbi:hypothetical protein ASE14_08275 [Agromyces sp. Root81]|uniref:hypothetical protein n=1 Tax=Agromyces sp. Root81 TaxID=1736601 RepID=UPI0006F76DBA|nr:hypothetical protein [Agromyces sp. Root81]KRC60943.1 hypothetical protein ASE14_08275 [Agromyces sp. Root81]
MSVFRPGAVELERPAEYRGQTTVAIRASQLPGLTAREQAKLIDDWCRFFEAGPTGIWDVTFPMRMPKRLFDSLASQTQLRRLAVQWGVFDDLTALSGMSHLVELELDSATSVTTLEPLRALTTLEALEIGGAWRVHDYSAVGDLTVLRQLKLGGGSEKRQEVHSLDFLTGLRELRQLSLDLVPDDLDYSPLLALTWVEEIHLSTLETHRKRMTPSMTDLEWALPGLQRRQADELARRHYVWQRGERVGDYRANADGEWYLHRYDIHDDA